MRTTFFALAALPFFAVAQDPIVPEPVPTTTGTSEAFIQPVIAPTTTSEAIIIPETTPEVVPEDPETTTQVPIVQDTTTEQPFVQDTTTQVPPIPQDTTTEQLPPSVESTTQAIPPPQDTTTEQAPPVLATSSEELPPVAGTTEDSPIAVDTTTGPAPIDTTTELPPLVIDTTTELPPPVIDTTTGFPPVDVSTNQTPGIETTSQDVQQDTTTEAQVPVVPTTSDIIPDLPETTDISNAPLPETTTDLPPAVETTTDVPVSPPETTTEQISAQDTTTAVEQQPAETTTKPEPKPTTEEEAKPTTKEEEADPSSKEEESPVITQAPEPTTAPPEATSSVSSVSSQVAALIPIIDKWKEDPESLKDETNKEVEDTHDDIIAVIVALGGSPDVGCSTKKRGLLGPIGDIINKLACMAQDLTNISGNIVAGNVPAVTGAVSGVQSKNDELTDEQQDDDDEDEKSEEKSEEKSTKQEESTQEKSTEAPTTTAEPTTTEAPTSTEETTTTEATTTTGMPKPCASGSCGGGDSCPMEPGPGKDGQIPDERGGAVNCADIPTSTTDGPLPTKPGGFKDPFSAPPTSRPLAEKRDLDSSRLERRFEDDTSPNPAYVSSLNPLWVSQVGDASGHWFNAPGPAGRGSAGVNGIYGCTAVMIVSNLGVYLSHIWENPVFIDGDWNFKPEDEFQAKSFQALRDGTLDGNALSITSLIGTDENPGVLHAINEPKVFVVTPFTTQADTTLYGINTLYRYEDRANGLASDLASIIPGSTSQVLGYIRTDARQSTEVGYWGRAIVEFDMLEEVIQSAEQDEILGLGIAMGRWRLWVEDYLVTSHKFFVFPPAANTGGQQKRADDDAAHSCLIRGDSTATASSGPTSTEAIATSAEPTSTEAATSAEPTSTEVATTSDATSAAETTETSAGPTTEDATTTETKAEETTQESSAGTTTAEETSTSDETTTKPPTTLMTSFITTTSAPTTTADTYTGPYPCNVFGGPRVETPHCQCSTTTAGQTFITTAALISGQCSDYHEYPSPITLAPTEAPAPPEPTPFTTTMDNGAILGYPDQTVKVGNYPGGSYTYTQGSGDATTIRPADPVQTDGNNKGSSQCHSIDNACDRAIDNFKDDVIYTEFASYYARIKSGIIVLATFGQAGCVVEFDCDDWSVGGLNGKQIKEEYQYMKDNTGVNKCGSGYMSNTCRVTANYCTNCNERHQQID
ncbi:hypothetical protein FLONG3_6315 [Fusarium longipes]|uniref:Uncharacterized protein n=1 Tax=Fusarium longipes TaxID=694270 RepID=A0A395SMC2_9HYPO|nr:hypothetical protein FLONG3_6315 [Fusarium longipes]